MVLHHVAQRAGDVVKLAALFHAQRFGNGNLHGLDVILIPQGFEQAVAEAQRQKVLQAFFAQVVVDAVDLVFLEIGRHVFVDFAAGSQIRAERFFQHDADFGRIQACGGQFFAGGGEKFGRGGKVDDYGVGVGALVHFVGQCGKIGRFAYVQRQVVYALLKLRPGRIFDVFDVDFAVAPHFGQKFFAAEFAAAHAQDASLRMKQSGRMRLIQGGQQFAHGQIAGCAE